MSVTVVKCRPPCDVPQGSVLRPVLFLLYVIMVKFSQKACQACSEVSPKSRQNAGASTTTSAGLTDRLHTRKFNLATLNARSIRNKSAVLADVLPCHDLDVLAQTESWHEKDDDLAVRLVRPTGYRSLYAARSSSSVGLRKQRGGGDVLLYKDSISTRDSFRISPTTFEVIGASMSYSTSYVWCGRQ